MTDRSIILLEPTINGSIANFDSGWSTADVELAPGETRTVVVTLKSDAPEAVVESASLRFFSGGVISSPLALEYRDGEWQVSTSPAEAPLLMADTDQIVPDGTAITLTDSLSPEEAALLEEARAVICLRFEDETGPYYLPFCSVQAATDASGEVRAVYSGLTATFSEAADFPVFTTEKDEAGRISCAASGVEVLGDALFFAELSFEVVVEGDRMRVASLALKSPELGGECVYCPRSVFSEAEIHHPCYTFEDVGGSIDMDERPGRTIHIPLDRGLTVALRPASDLGEVYVYFEYYRTDGSTISHTPFRVYD